jgi:hypothetical protein
VDEAANSGIFIRCDKSDAIDSNICYEVNVFDKRPDPKYGTGAIVDVDAAVKTLRPLGVEGFTELFLACAQAAFAHRYDPLLSE